METNYCQMEVVLSGKRKEEKIMLWTIVAILVILWLLGFSFGVGGSLIHAILVIALIVFLLQVIGGRRG